MRHLLTYRLKHAMEGESMDAMDSGASSEAHGDVADVAEQSNAVTGEIQRPRRILEGGHKYDPRCRETTNIHEKIRCMRKIEKSAMHGTKDIFHPLNQYDIDRSQIIHGYETAQSMRNPETSQVFNRKAKQTRTSPKRRGSQENLGVQVKSAADLIDNGSDAEGSGLVLDGIQHEPETMDADNGQNHEGPSPRKSEPNRGLREYEYNDRDVRGRPWDKVTMQERLRKIKKNG